MVDDVNGLDFKYVEEMREATSQVRGEEVAGGLALLRDAILLGSGVYIFGNGGSASTASHLAADLGRNIGSETDRRLRVMALTDNAAWITAASNDGCFADCFVDQLRNLLRPEDLVIGISASGDSPNVVRAFEFARDAGARRLAMVGFDGGRLARLATSRIWVDSHDYGIVESIHLFVAHLFVRALAQDAMSHQTRRRGETSIAPDDGSRVQQGANVRTRIRAAAPAKTTTQPLFVAGS